MIRLARPTIYELHKNMMCSFYTHTYIIIIMVYTGVSITQLFKYFQILVHSHKTIFNTIGYTLTGYFRYTCTIYYKPVKFHLCDSFSLKLRNDN